jgi:hypothetical protein
MLGVMWLGATGHFWHHLTDPDCGAETSRGAQPCATCSAFHGGTIVSDPQSIAVGVPVAFTAITLPETERPALVRIVVGSPRAPPTV